METMGTAGEAVCQPGVNQAYSVTGKLEVLWQLAGGSGDGDFIVVI